MSVDYNDMLNDHLSYDVLKAELNNKSYLWKNLEHDENSVGDIVVPFQKQRASSVKLGAGPTAEDDISKAKYTRGSIAQSSRPLVWGSMIFNMMDILHHDGRVKQKSFLSTFLPKQVEQFTDTFAQKLNHGFLNSAALDTAQATGGADGVLSVSRVERFELDQKLRIDGQDYYVIGVNVNLNTITLADTRGGAATDISAEIASGVSIYDDSFHTGNQLSNLKSLLLSAANGGSANIYGVSKLASTYTQAVNVSGADITSNNILEKLFDAIATYRRKAKVGKLEMWMSYGPAAAIMKQLENDKGPYKTVPGSTKSSEYGFTEITIFGPETGAIKFVFLPEMDNDVIFGVVPGGMKIHSNKGIIKVKDPQGNMYHTIRSATNGFDYVTDLLFEGDIVVSEPSKMLAIHSIPAL
jgi:hypothetical protein